MTLMSQIVLATGSNDGDSVLNNTLVFLRKKKLIYKNEMLNKVINVIYTHTFRVCVESLCLGHIHAERIQKL